MAVVAQLVRVPDCGSVGRRFESDLPPEMKAASISDVAFFVFRVRWKHSLSHSFRPIGHFAGCDIAESLVNTRLSVNSKLSEAKLSLKNAL